MNKYCPPARTIKKMEEINNFQQEPDERLFRAWERFKELMMKCPQHYLTEIHEVILFYNGLDVPTRQILDSKGAIPTKTTADAKIAIQEIAEYSQKWHNRTSSKARSTETSDGLAYRAAGQGFFQGNNRNSSYPDRRQTLVDIADQVQAEVLKERGIGDCPAQHNQNYGTNVPFPRRLQDYYCDDWKEAQDVKILEAYDHNLPQKEKEQGSSFITIDDEDVIGEVALGMPFFMKVHRIFVVALVESYTVALYCLAGPLCSEVVILGLELTAIPSEVLVLSAFRMFRYPFPYNSAFFHDGYFCISISFSGNGTFRVKDLSGGNMEPIIKQDYFLHISQIVLGIFHQEFLKSFPSSEKAFVRFLLKVINLLHFLCSMSRWAVLVQKICL
ncbi:hypothetical protein Tco_0000982 [Tanacetum coccineum]